jgi:hypothetical protein
MVGMFAGRRRILASGALGVLAVAYAACGVPIGDPQGSGANEVEQGRAECTDGLDNDGDGRIDCEESYCDPVCVEICTDYVDNDGDGFNGCDDPKCAGQPCFTPHEVCWNQIDEDANGLSGCDDPACVDTDECRMLRPEICDNGSDDNVDGKADCDDPACELAPNCEQCDDGIDNDADGLTDCEDLPRCRIPCGLVENCSGGTDEDRDGAIDCTDSDCKGDVACIVGCRVRLVPDRYGRAPTYTDSCRIGKVCTCAGAPGCPTEDPNVGQVIGDFVGVSELCEEPQTCEDGGGCRDIEGVYTLRLHRAGADFDFFAEPELYVEVNGERLTEIEDSFDIVCDDCYRLITVRENDVLDVKLWDRDIFPIPDGDDIDHDDLVVGCTFTLADGTLKERALNCWGDAGFVELTIEPHTG